MSPRPPRALALAALALLAALAATGGQADEMPAGFVHLRALDPSIRQEIHYSGSHNFVGHPLPGYDAPECLLKRAVAEALAEAQKDLASDGLTLKMFDCYRPQSAVAAMHDWVTGRDPSPGDPRYFPGLDRATLVARGYIARRSLHSTGTAVDLTLARMAAPPSGDPAGAALRGLCTGAFAERSAADEIDMGTGFDCFDAKGHTAAKVGAAQRRWRKRLVALMARHGFENFAGEWWHFSFKDRSARSDAYDFPIRALGDPPG